MHYVLVVVAGLAACKGGSSKLDMVEDLSEAYCDCAEKQVAQRYVSESCDTAAGSFEMVWRTLTTLDADSANAKTARASLEACEHKLAALTGK